MKPTIFVAALWHFASLVSSLPTPGDNEHSLIARTPGQSFETSGVIPPDWRRSLEERAPHAEDPSTELQDGLDKRILKVRIFCEDPRDPECQCEASEPCDKKKREVSI